MMTADNNEQNPESTGGLLDEVAKVAAEEAAAVEAEETTPPVADEVVDEEAETDESAVEPSADTIEATPVTVDEAEPAAEEEAVDEAVEGADTNPMIKAAAVTDVEEAEVEEAEVEEADEADEEEESVEAAATEGQAVPEPEEDEEEEGERDPVTGELIVEPEPVVITATPDDGKRWYVVHTYSGYENKAKQALEDRIRAHSMEEFFGDVLVPSEKVTEVRGGQKRTTTRKFFPGYMFVRMDLNDQTWHLVKNTPRVTGFVGGGKNPPPVPDEEVNRITDQIADGTLKPTPTLAFEKGETVRVVEGPFMNFNGIVEEVIPDKKRVKVIVSILGRSTPVEFDFDEIEKT